MKITANYPLLPVRNAVVLPYTSMYLVVGRKESIIALKEAQITENKNIVVVAQRPEFKSSNIINESTVYNVGTLCKVENVIGSDKVGYQVLITGISRFVIENIIQENNFNEVHGHNWPDNLLENDIQAVAIFKTLKSLAKEILDLMPKATEAASPFLENVKNQDELLYICASFTNLTVKKKQELLENNDIKEKMENIIRFLKKEREVILLEKDIQVKINQRLSKAQREALLREQLSAIKEELDEGSKDLSLKYKEKIRAAQMPSEVETIAQEELNRLVEMHHSSAEYHVIQNYLDLLIEMPWAVSTKDKLDIAKAKLVLEKHHYGLNKVKKRILQHLAVIQNMQDESRGTILCFTGAPGVGKTSLGKSIAESLGRKFARVSLGGIRDESEMRGHRRTYIGAMPGRIIQAIKRTHVNNPVIVLDEIDKVGAGHMGDPAAALLEILDPEQNSNFTDHYLDVPFDLSKVIFITTANRLDTIPIPLRDRMEVVEITGYTPHEKHHIAERFIIPEVLKKNGLKKSQLHFSNSLVDEIILYYTQEAGVRELFRVFDNICRCVVYELLEKEIHTIELTAQKLQDYLGPHKYNPYRTVFKNIPGIVKGMAWTPYGGEILHIESIKMKGKGELKLTGQLGEVMKESAQIALSFLRSISHKLNEENMRHEDEIDFEKWNIHLHVPAGAIPKDGPSAGIAMMCAMASLITGITVDKNIAMTGELSLTGHVLPVGGIREKVIAAHRNKAKLIILPFENKKDLYEIPDEVKQQVEFLLVESAYQVLNICLEIDLSEQL